MRSSLPLDTPPPPSPAGRDTTLRRLAAGLAHSVNNALTGVTGYLELALRQTAPGSEIQAHLRGALACAHQAADTVRRIVAFASRSPGRPALAPVSLRAVAEEAAERVREQGAGRIKVVMAASSPGWVQAGDALLRAALDQVLRNALEAMPHGGVLTLRVEEEGGWPCLRVGDSGPGLPAPVLAHPFEPFRTTKTSGHLGLGLVLCREAVQVQDGLVLVASAPGQGTTVTLAFPPLREGAPRTDQQSGLPHPHSPLVDYAPGCVL
jgi:signal transduction histidine kinase